MKYNYYFIIVASNLFTIGLTSGIVQISGTIDRETTSRYIVSLSVCIFYCCLLTDMSRLKNI